MTVKVGDKAPDFTLPSDGGGKVSLKTLKGKKVINVFEHDGRDSAGDQTDFSSVHAAHKAIVEQVIEVDDELTLEYLEKGEGAGFDPTKLHAAFEKALGDAHLVPICFCSAKTGAGIEPALLAQFPLLEEALGALGVAVWPMVEFEADDALAAAAEVASRDTRVDRIIICTPDKDLAQCVRGTRVVQMDRR